MPRQTILLLGGALLIVVCVLFSAWQVPPLTSGDPPTVTTVSTRTVPTSIRKLNINTASAAQLETVPRISEKLAQQIIEFRQQNGGFSSLYSLTALDGVTESHIRQWEEYLTVSDENT